MAELDPALNKCAPCARHIHIIGICGTGMAALAGMLQQKGFYITGSDSHVYPPMSDFLNSLNIRVMDGYHSDNLQPAPDLVIVGNVITADNPEACALGKTTIPYLSFPQALSHFFISDRTSLVVAGTHGKTTTCSLLASAMYSVGLDPTFMIGGIVREFNSNFRLGNGPCFIAEGDEYDTAFFDKESKFLHYRPRVAVITSIEFDHADIFKDLTAIKNTFLKFVRLIPEDGLLIANLDDPNVAEIAEGAHCKIEGYGQGDHIWSLKNIRPDEGKTHFTVFHKGHPYGEMSVRLPGRHNCMNSLAVTAVMHHLGIETDRIHQGLSSFSGVKRRQEVRGIEKEITVIDDFAHHPTAVKETVRALKDAYDKQRLIIVFEPRTNSSRRAIFQKEYAASFDSADIVLVREPVPLKNVAHDQMFSSRKLAEDLRTMKGLDAEAFDDTDKIIKYLMKSILPGDVIAVLSNGGFDNIHDRLLQKIKEKPVEVQEKSPHFIL
ncbi:UDP-N-acetylmuramate:L-alanyl-gamma-D-glutamyl-meso-diaminopimelate ligase [Desulfomarina sp.]